MINWILSKTIGTQNDRMLKRYAPVVRKISALEPEIQRLTDAELQAKTHYFKERLKAAGFKEIQAQSMMLGIIVLYQAVK